MNTKTVLLFLLVVILSVGTGIIYDNLNTNKPFAAIPFKETRSVMDTTVTIEVIDTDETHAVDAINRAFDEIYYVDGLMDSYDNQSEVGILNQKGMLNNANPDLIYVLERSKYYSEVSGGAFDVTINPILDLWKSKYSPGGTFAPPTPEEINETLQLVNYSNIIIEAGNITLEPNMSIVLGGVAKGYSVDRAIESLKRDGIENGFVNAGGDGRFIGFKEKDTTWKVGLQNPNKTEDVVTIVNVHDMAVATSGNYERYFSEAAKVSHISDPRTGYSSEKLISATIIANTAMDADALATAVFVLGEEEGIEMIEKLDGVECLIITADKRIIRSSGFAEYEETE
jgi:thiamine biosynthesis lipoprotein